MGRLSDFSAQDRQSLGLPAIADGLALPAGTPLGDLIDRTSNPMERSCDGSVSGGCRGAVTDGSGSSFPSGPGEVPSPPLRARTGANSSQTALPSPDGWVCAAPSLLSRRDVEE
jgi:hypothetical protein